jgi:hypothetical protein
MEQNKISTLLALQTGFFLCSISGAPLLLLIWA